MIRHAPRTSLGSLSSSTRSPATKHALRGFQTSPARRSDIQTVGLAYDLHNTGKCKTDPSTCGPPIVFLHGLFGSKANNRTMSKRLSQDLNRPVYALDLRNHGSSPHAFPHTYTTLAADVHTFITANKLQNPCLIGHSMGAKTAMLLALQHPRLISALVAVDNSPVDSALGSDFPAYVRGMREVSRLQPRKQSEASAILETYAAELPVRQFLLTNMIHAKDGEGKDGLAWRIPLDGLARGLDHMGDFPAGGPEAARYEGPMLVVRGTRSRYVPDEALPLFGRYFPRFRVVDVDAGHWVISEKPEEFRRAVVDFLGDQS